MNGNKRQRDVLFLAVLFVMIVDGLFATSCPPIKVRRDTIIRTKESIRNGAKMLHRTDVSSSRECYGLCCERKACDIAVIHYKKIMDEVTGQMQSYKSCFVFDCGVPNRCSFMNHTAYAVIEMKRSSPKPKAKKVKKVHPVIEEVCPPGSPVAMCLENPCTQASCSADPTATCVPSYCGGCNAVFYNAKGKKLHCSAKNTIPKEPQGAKVTDETQGTDAESSEGSNENEEELEIRPEDTGGKPTEDPDYSASDEKDPHAVKQWRTWLDTREKGVTTTTATTVLLTTKSTETNGTLSDLDESIKLKKLKKKDSSFSLALGVALIICIVVLMAIIIKMKCMGPRKKKKFAVDDGDYLINGMYL